MGDARLGQPVGERKKVLLAGGCEDDGVGAFGGGAGFTGCMNGLRQGHAGRKVGANNDVVVLDF
jgi:hypothetical protein